MNFTEDVTELMEARGVSWTWSWSDGPGIAHVEERRVRCPRPDSVRTFSNALHELGHIAVIDMDDHVRDCPRFVREAKASDFALQWVQDNQPGIYDQAREHLGQALAIWARRAHKAKQPPSQLSFAIPDSELRRSLQDLAHVVASIPEGDRGAWWQSMSRLQGNSPPRDPTYTYPTRKVASCWLKTAAAV